MVSPKKSAVIAGGDLSAAGPQPQQNERLIKIAIFAVALLLRVYGLGWGLPNASRYYSYHPDESMVAGAALSLNPFLLKVDPHFYNYGSLSLLLDSAVVQIGAAAHLIASGPLPGIPSAGDLLAARLVTVVLGASTCLILYATGKLLYGRVSGVAAAGFYAVAPLAVQHGHWATVDIPATFWIAGSLYFAARAASSGTRSSDFFWCGVWAGLAAATKYNAGIVLLSGLAAIYFHRIAWRRSLFLLILGALGALIAGSPAILLNPRGVRDAIVFESGHAKTGHGDVFTGTLPGFLYHIVVSLNWGLTIPLLAVVLAGVAFAVWKRKPEDIILLAYAAPYYLLIGLAQVKFARYTLPLFPPLFLLAGSVLQAIHSSSRRGFRIGGYVLCGGAAASALLLSLALDRTMTRPDTRDTAAAFLHAQGIRSVGFATGPWFFSPTLGPFLTSPRPDFAQQSAAGVTDIHLIPCIEPAAGLPAVAPSEYAPPVEWDYDLIDSADPDAVAVSEYEYADAQRIPLPSAEDFLGKVEKNYPVRHTFSKPLEVFGIRFTNLSHSGGELPTQGCHTTCFTQTRRRSSSRNERDARQNTGRSGL